MILDSTLHNFNQNTLNAWIYRRRPCCWVTECPSGKNSFSANEWSQQVLEITVSQCILAALDSHQHGPARCSAVSSIDWPDYVVLGHWFGILQVFLVCLKTSLSVVMLSDYGGQCNCSHRQGRRMWKVWCMCHPFGKYTTYSSSMC